MKKQIVTGMVALALCATVVSAETASSTDGMKRWGHKRDEIRQNFEEKKGRVQDRIEEKRAAFDQKCASSEDEKCERRRFEKHAKDRVGKITDKVFGRFEAFVARYEGFADRIQSRIDKLEEKSVNTDEMQDLLDKAEESLEDTVAAIAAAKDEVKELVEGESEKGQIRTVIEEAKASLKETHKAFVEAVKALKASDKDKPEDSEEDEDEDSDE